MLLELNIAIKYKPGQYPELDHPAANTRLRKHLSALGFLHPKPANVHFTGGESAEFFWITERNSVRSLSSVCGKCSLRVLWTHFASSAICKTSPRCSTQGTRTCCSSSLCAFLSPLIRRERFSVFTSFASERMEMSVKPYKMYARILLHSTPLPS